MIDPKAATLVGAPFPLRIEAGKVRELLRALHDDTPVAADATIPPTFLTTAFFWEREVPGADLWPQVGMDPKRGVHAEQSYEFFGPPPRAGQALWARSRIGRVYEKPGRKGGPLTFVELLTDYHDDQGRLVARATMTAVETSPPPTEGA